MISNRKPLYRLVLVCVLLATACASEEPANSTDVVPAETGTRAESKVDRARILMLGDSITAGYGLDPAQAFPARLQALIDSAGYDYEVVAAGLSGETTAGGRRRVEWLLRNEADILLIELGGNDGLRGVDPESVRENLTAIITTARARNSDMTIILGGMRMPMNMGGAYRERFESVYPEVAAANDVVLIPHILEGVGGIQELNQPDGIHPTADGHEIIARTVWATLEPILKRGA
ncbi:MAG: arylesterase [Rhodothermales bacterium]|nr:arylesterase [Rhodothermales bacterium]